VRLVLDHQDEHESQWAAITSIAHKVGCSSEALCKWVRQAERDAGMRGGLTTDERGRMKDLERENRELRRANEILRKASAYFAQASRRPAHRSDDQVHRRPPPGARSRADLDGDTSRAPSTDYEHKAREGDAARLPLRARRDAFFAEEIRRVYGARKVWLQLRREGLVVARCAVARLMAQMGLRGVVRGRRSPTTTVAGSNDGRPADLVNREFVATRPNQLWIADFNFVATCSGWVYVAFVINVFARMIAGRRVATTMSAELTLDALEQAIWARDLSGKLIHHSNRGSQYLSVRYTGRLAEEGIEPSVGSVGDSYDNAMAESIIGLYKTEVIRPRGPWRTLEAVEYATLEWVDWFNNRRLLGPIGDIPPAEFERVYYSRVKAPAMVAGLN
jgi:transposase InsO family protein/transposase-like protein